MRRAGRLAATKATVLLRLALFCSLFAAISPTSRTAAQSGPATDTTSPAAPPPTAEPTPSVPGPRAYSLPGTPAQHGLFIKPGHWAAVQVELSAGKEADVRGTLSASWLDSTGASIYYPPLEFGLRSEQPVVVPKSSTRRSEQLLFVPNEQELPQTRQRQVTHSPLREGLGLLRLGDATGLGGATSPEVRPAIEALRDHQALFVVLAARPGDYAFLETFDALTTPHAASAFPEQEAHYRTVYLDANGRSSLPSNAAAWTTTAYVLWDGYDLATLSDAQRTALLDWLHWGGTLIVAGPGTLDLPVAEPLRDWLPAASDGVTTFDIAALTPLADERLLGETLNTAANWTGLKLRPQTGAQITLGTDAAPLIVERRIGRGRIIATAFRPTQRELIDWSSYPALFNTRLMRRPARRWTTHPTVAGLAIVSWSDEPFLPTDDQLRSGVPDPWFNPDRVTHVRYFSRGPTTESPRPTPLTLERPIGPGTAAWRDDDAIAEAARAGLREMSGIFIPSAATVSLLVGGYVLLAVPLNWLLFRSLRRTEWAWAALPVLAIGYTAVVIRAAGLDLGFVRSVGETTLIEIQPDYDRAHVTRFTSLFNSLGTEYRLVGEDPTITTLPFPLQAKEKGDRGQTSYQLVQTTDEKGQRSQTLLGTVVDSNSIAAVRSEQMTSLGGTLTAAPLGEERYRLRNGTVLELRNIRLLGRQGDEAHLDLLGPGVTTDVTLAMAASSPKTDPQAESWHALFAAHVGDNRSLMLTAETSTDVPGQRIEPTPSQRRARAFVFAVLRYADDPPPQRDVNTQQTIEAQFKPARSPNAPTTSP